MREGGSLHLRGEENAGFPLQTHSRNAEVGTTDEAGGHPDKRVQAVARQPQGGIRTEPIMIAKISSGSNVYGVLAYNNIKVEAGNGKIL